jgi:hypothetical protein
MRVKLFNPPPSLGGIEMTAIIVPQNMPGTPIIEIDALPVAPGIAGAAAGLPGGRPDDAGVTDSAPGIRERFSLDLVGKES